MRKLIVALAFILSAGYTFAARPDFGSNTQLNLGVGLSDYGIPLYVGFDSYVSRDVTLGAEASYRTYNGYWNNFYYDNILGVSGNVNYHLNNAFHMPSRWDLYIGANLGLYFWHSPDGFTDHTGLGLGAQLGVRYYVSNRVGLNLEFGGGNAFNGGKFGITVAL